MTYWSHRTYALGRAACSLLLGSALVGSVMPRSAQANAIVGSPIDWDGSGPTVAWAAQGDPVAATVSENDAGADDFLQISFADISATPGPGAHWHETVSGARSDLFTGTWITDYWIEFDFWAQDVLPDTLQIRWADSDSERIWANTLTPSGVGSWSTLRTDSFSNLEAWRMSPFATAGELLADLNSIDWIGVYMFRDGTDAELYGVDDFKLMVPEPEEYLMLAAALVTALLVMRRQKRIPAVQLA
jgi:hypothetical protein